MGRYRATNCGTKCEGNSSVIMTFAALLMISLATSTREGREAARAALAPYDRPIWLASGALWLVLLWP